ncbi:histidine kinase [Polaribacter pacificus]|uniref:Histidine kinase n=1 Tax=Polaribacter pacificus TaxID=1775173 RepID=A0A917HZA8_9FLAO|nr:histidine kinase [Polaribacter pacificus]
MAVFNLQGQKKQYIQYSIEEGLPQSQIIDITEDAFGYLYLATQGGGLARFDGKEFNVFTQKNGLESNYINALVAHKDSLFIGTNQGLTIKVRDSFVSYKSPKILKIIKVQKHWYFATNQGVYLLKNNYLQPLKANQKIDLAPVNDLVFYKGSFWAANHLGLWKIEDFDNSSNAALIQPGHFTAIYKQQNSLIVGSLKSGLFSIQNGTSSQENKYILDINSIGSFDDEQLWITTNTNGIYLINKQKLSVVKHSGTDTGLPTNAFTKIYKDHQKNIWIATSGAGLLKQTVPKFKHFDSRNGFNNTRVTTVLATQDALWVSNSKQQLIKKDSLGFYTLENPFIKSKITSIAADSTNSIWLTTAKNGLFIYKKENDSARGETPYKHLNSRNGLPHDQLSQVVPNKEKIWLATVNKGIVQLDYNFDKGFVKSSTLFNGVKGIKDLSISTIALDKSQKLWYATNNGALGYIFNNKVYHYTEILNQRAKINAITIHKGVVFIGTQEKGIWFAKSNQLNNFKLLKGQKELTFTTCNQLLFDAEDHLWVGTANGVISVELSENNEILTAQHYDATDGFVGVETSLNAISLDPNGSIWFGTQRGLSQYTAMPIELSKIKPRLYFEELKINFNTLDNIDINSNTKTLNLKPLENNVAFRFKTVDLNNPTQVVYRWKLNKGNYSPWTTQNTVEFANLNSSMYTFTVQSKNKQDLLSEEESILFYIDSPFYQKQWFLFSVIGASLAILLLAVAYYLKREKTKNLAKLKQLKLENHLLTLEQKALQLQMNPHFIFNVLNGIKALNNRGEKVLVNSTVNQFALLLRGILENSREEEISLKQEIETLKNYVALEQQMSEKQVELVVYSAIEKIDLDEILIPPMLLQPFVENSIKHAFDSNNTSAKIEITFSLEKQFLCCSITDNGKGYIETQLGKEKSKHKSKALKITKERIESLSTLAIFRMEELKENKKITGTKVWFKIPLKTDY